MFVKSCHVLWLGVFPNRANNKHNENSVFLAANESKVFLNAICSPDGKVEKSLVPGTGHKATQSIAVFRRRKRHYRKRPQGAMHHR